MNTNNNKVGKQLSKQPEQLGNETMRKVSNEFGFKVSLNLYPTAGKTNFTVDLDLALSNLVEDLKHL